MIILASDDLAMTATRQRDNKQLPLEHHLQWPHGVWGLHGASALLPGASRWQVWADEIGHQLVEALLLLVHAIRGRRRFDGSG